MFTECRCRISLITSAAIPSAALWRSLACHQDANTYTHLGLEDATDELNGWKIWRMPERDWKRTRKKSPSHKRCFGQSNMERTICALLWQGIFLFYTILRLAMV